MGRRNEASNFVRHRGPHRLFLPRRSWQTSCCTGYAERIGVSSLPPPDLEIRFVDHTTMRIPAMTTRYVALCAAAVLAAVALQATSANALTMAECSAKYKDAKTAGTLNGMKWNDFRKAQCGSEATAAPAAAHRHGVCPCSRPGTGAPAPKPAAAPSRLVMPCSRARSIPNIQRIPRARRRMETCLDQYKANKANNGNGGLKWIRRAAAITANATSA